MVKFDEELDLADFCAEDDAGAYTAGGSGRFGGCLCCVGERAGAAFAACRVGGAHRLCVGPQRVYPARGLGHGHARRRKEGGGRWLFLGESRTPCVGVFRGETWHVDTTWPGESGLLLRPRSGLFRVSRSTWLRSGFFGRLYPLDSRSSHPSPRPSITASPLPDTLLSTPPPQHTTPPPSPPLPPQPPGDGPLSYRLHAAVVHQGSSLHSGHYCCYARAPSGVWHSYDDGSVQQVSAQRVLQGEAYLLFYVRVPPPRDEACRAGAPGLKNAGTPRVERPAPLSGSGGSPPHRMGAPPADEPRKALRAGLGDGPLVEEADAGIPLQAAPAPAGVMPRRTSAAGRLRMAQSHVTYPAEQAEGTGSSPCRPHALIAGGSGLLPRLSLLPRRWLRPGKARGGRLAPQPRRHGETPMIPRAADAYPPRQLAPSPLRREPRHAALTHPGAAAASPPPAPTGIASIGSAAARAGAPFTAGAASLFTEAVGTWDGVLLSSDAQRARREEARAANRGKRQRHYDAYEAEYDRGRLKKPLRQALAREAAAAAPAMASRARGRGGAGRGRGRVSKKY
eukprot:scaffold5946_cov114-Isochrysis_galbana.AAC.3